MYAAFGKPGAIRQAPDALLAVCTNRVENDNTLGPQSHGVGPCSEGWLQLEKSALQSTRSTAGCPALRGCPPVEDATHRLLYFLLFNPTARQLFLLHNLYYRATELLQQLFPLFGIAR